MVCDAHAANLIPQYVTTKLVLADLDKKKRHHFSIQLRLLQLSSNCFVEVHLNVVQTISVYGHSGVKFGVS